MVSKRQNLPSLGSFATFEVAAKHLSFTLAAGELNVTQAAVSQQIRYLETSLGHSLFFRKPGGLELTDEGRELLRGVTNGLDCFSLAVSSIQNKTLSRKVTIAGTNSAAQLWLYPLARQYMAANPDVDIIILGSDRDESMFNFQEVDIALVFGARQSSAANDLEFLYPEVVKPVCSPSFLAGSGPFESREALLECPLLHLHTTHWTANAIDWTPQTWNKWFGIDIVDEQETLPGFKTNSYALLIDLAKNGEGIVLGFQHLVAENLQSGSLCVAHDHALPSGRNIYLQKKRSRQASSDHVDSVFRFMVEESASLEFW